MARTRSIKTVNKAKRVRDLEAHVENLKEDLIDSQNINSTLRSGLMGAQLNIDAAKHEVRTVTFEKNQVIEKKEKAIQNLRDVIVEMAIEKYGVR